MGQWFAPPLSQTPCTWSSETCHEFEAGKITVDRERRIATMMSHYCLKVSSKWRFLRWRNVFREKYFLHTLSVNSFKMFLKLRIVRHWQISVYFLCFKHVVNTDSQVIHCVHQNKSTNVLRETCNAPVTVPKSSERRGRMFLIPSFYPCKSTPRCWVSQWEHVAPSRLSPRNSIETWALRSFVSTFPRSAGNPRNLVEMYLDW